MYSRHIVADSSIVMNSSLCVLIALSFCLGDATVLKIKDPVGGGGFEFDINGGGWTSGIAGSTASRAGLGGGLTFRYTGLRTPIIPLISGDHNKQQEQVKDPQIGQGHSGYPQLGQGFVLQGHGGYLLQGNGGFPAKYGIPLQGANFPLPGIGGYSNQKGKPIGIPSGENVGINIPQAGSTQPGGQGNYFPHRGQGNYIPQSPQAGHPSGHAPQNPQVGYPNQDGHIPQNHPQTGQPSQGAYIPQNPQIGFPAGYIPQNPQTGFPSGYIPQNPQTGYPNQGGYIPQNPQTGYPNQGGYIPQNPQTGYPNQGGFIPQNPQTGYPSQNGYVPQNPQAGYPPRPHTGGPNPGQGYGGGVQPGGPIDEPAAIDPRNGDGNKTTEKPTLKGRRRTLGPEENPQTTQGPTTTEVPAEGDEESLDENAIPEDKD